MTMYVYQIEMSNDQINELNEKGWGNTDWDKTYMEMTFNPGNHPHIATLIDGIIENDLIQHTKTIDSDDLDEVFKIGNGFGDLTKMKAITKSKSISIGDILINAKTGDGFIVDRFGFYPMESKLTLTIQQTIDTHMAIS